MRSSKVIIKHNAQKHMARFGFGHKFHNLNYFDLDFFFTFLHFIIHLRSSSNICVEIIKSMKIYHILNTLLTITRSLSPLAHPLAPYSTNMYIVFKTIFVNINCLSLQINVKETNLIIVFSQNSNLAYCFESLSLEHIPS